jgi:hypothetical protein
LGELVLVFRRVGRVEKTQVEKSQVEKSHVEKSEVEKSHVETFSISEAIASLLLHKNEQNKIDSERTRKDEEIEPIPDLLAQFV